MRRTRKSVRKAARRAEQKKRLYQVCGTAVVVSLLSGAWLPVRTEAAWHDPLLEVAPTLQNLRQARETIVNVHHAQSDLRTARANVETGRKNLADAQQAVTAARNAVAEDEKNLHDSTQAVAQSAQAVQDAQALSAQRTREAIAAQQAAYDYWQVIAERQADVDALTAQRDAAQQAVASAQAAVVWQPGGEGSVTYHAANRAEAVARAIDELGYDQNNMDVVEALADQYMAEGGYTEVSGSDGRYVTDASAVASAEQQQAEAEKWQDEAKSSLAQAVKDADTVAHGFWNFGSSRGIQFGMLYDHTKGEERRDGMATAHRGHQTYFPLSVYMAERLDRYPGQDKISDAAWPHGDARHWLETGLSAGWLGSYQNGPQGTSAGLLDMALSVRYHSEHPTGGMIYGLTVSLPTGQHRSYDKARVPQGLAFFQDFGAGWQIVPEMEGVRRVTEGDSVHAKLSYEVRRSYDYRKESWDDNVDPGDIIRGRLSYRHIGEREQAETWLRGSYTGRTTQTADGEPGTYRDGAEFEIGWAYSGRWGEKDDFEAYTTYGHQRRTSAVWEAKATDDNEIAIGVHHMAEPSVHWQVLASRFHSTTGYDTLYREADTGAWTRWSLLTRVDWQASSTESWAFSLERYRRREQGRVPYQGVAAALWYTHAF